MSEDEKLIQEVDEEILDIEEDEETDGAPNLATIEAWKTRYGRVFLLRDMEGDEYYFRPMSRKEYKSIMKIADADVFYREERVCEMCLLWPSGFTAATADQFKAGVPSVLLDRVMEKSGFMVSAEPIEL